MLDAIEDDLWLQRMKLEHSIHCGAMDYSAGGECFTKHWEQVLDVQSRIEQQLFPWVPKTDRATTAKRMSDQWEKEFGSIDDPETHRKIRATVEFLHRNAAKARQQNIFGGNK